jgi:Secretion system C-terminal sorting domain
MFKRLLLITLLFTGSLAVSHAQNAQLRIISLTNFPDTAFEGVSYMISMNLKNVGTAPYQGPLQILIQGDSLIDQLYFSNNPNFALLPNDTVTLIANGGGTFGYNFSPQYFRPGNDIVVVWPYTTQFNVLIDTLYTAVYFVPLAGVNEYAAEPFQFFPNPFANLIHYSLAGNEKVEQVRIFDANGRISALAIPDNNTIDLSVLKEGFYFLQIKTNERTIIRKILKD